MSSNYNYTAGEDMNIPQKMNVFKRLGNLIFSPKNLFLYLKNKPAMLFPLILCSIGTIAVQLLMMESMKDTRMDAIYNAFQSAGRSLYPDQIESLIKPVIILTVAASPFIIIAGWAIRTLFLYCVFSLVNCEKGLKKYFSMTAYIMLLSVARDLIHSLFLYFFGGNNASVYVTSLASLLDPEIVGNFLYGIASSLEVFNIWKFVLYGIGFAYIGNVSKKKSYATAAVLFVLSMLLGAGWAVLRSRVLAGMSG